MELSKSEKRAILQFNFIKSNKEIEINGIDVNEFRSCIVEDIVKEKYGVRVFCSEVYSQLDDQALINKELRKFECGNVKISLM